MSFEDLCEAWSMVRRRIKLRQLDTGVWEFHPGCFGRYLNIYEAEWIVEMEYRYSDDW